MIDDNGNEIIRYAYAGGIGATRIERDGTHVSHGTVSIQATNHAIAIEMANDSALVTYPPKDGWYDHRGYASKIPLDHIIEIVETYNLLVSRGIDYGEEPLPELDSDVWGEVDI